MSMIAATAPPPVTGWQPIQTFRNIGPADMWVNGALVRDCYHFSNGGWHRFDERQRKWFALGYSPTHWLRVDPPGEG